MPANSDLRYRVETTRLALCFRPLTALDQEQEPGSTGGVLKRASASRSSGHWSDDDFDGLADPWQAPDVDFSFRAPRGSNADHGYAARARLPWLRLPRVGGGNE